tara:strand:- start:109 stop:477 length:369 start_codon:yes stop_codon:yes gene_type:complete
MSNLSKILFSRRKNRNRFSIRKKSSLNHRLVVFRSNSNIYAQLIDDATGNTLLAVSSLDKNLKKTLNNKGGNIKAASLIGGHIAKQAIEKGIKKVFFDRGGYIYHGRVKALAESAREVGLKF